MKEYILRAEINDDGLFKIESTNDGFSPLELMGILEWKRDDIVQQIKGEVKPDSVNRNFVEGE